MHMPSHAPYQKLSIVGLGWGLSAALALLYALCWLAVFIAPTYAHGWLALFSNEAPGSAVALLAGIFWSIIFGWVSAAVLGGIYNYVAQR